MQNEIITILGRKGSGKTRLSKHIIRAKKRVLIYDPIGQFSDCGVVINNPMILIGYLKRNFTRNFRAVYQPPDDISTDIAKEFKHVCEIVHCLEDIYFLVDEVDTYVTSSYCPPYFNNLVQRGRHKRISLVVTTRRHTETTRHLTAQSDILISFSQHEPNDLKYLGTFFGKEAEKLPTLPLYHYLKFEHGKVTLERPV